MLVFRLLFFGQEKSTHDFAIVLTELCLPFLFM